MMILRPLFAAALWLLLASPLAAQTETAAPAGSAPTTRQDLERTVRILEDAALREQLLADTKALLAAEKAAAGPGRGEPALVARLLQAVSDRVASFGRGVEIATRNAGDPGRLAAWLRLQVENPVQRGIWTEVLLNLLLVLGGGLLAGMLVMLALSGWERRIQERPAAGVWQKVPLLLARAVLEVLPIAAFAAAAYAVLTVADVSERVRLVVLAAVNAAVLAGACITLVRLLLSPMVPSLRLFRMDDDAAAYLYIWLRRFIHIGIYGYFLLQAGRLLGLPLAGYLVALRLLGLLIAVLLLVLVLQNRDSVARVVAGNGELGKDARPLRVFRRRLSEVWHILAVFYVVALYVVWALEIRGGFEYMVRGTVLSLVVIAAARIVIWLAARGIDRLLSINQDLLRRYPLLERRTDRYLPYLKRGILLVLQIVALLAVLAAWQVDIGGVLASDAGRLLLTRVVKVGLIVIIALLVWELASGFISAYLERKDAEGRTLLRSARARTLLPLIRNALLVVIAIMAVLTTLSEIGINIAPLLAGAGVAGLAIGFGAQALVKDVITGGFILFENTVSIGDVASINGTSGLVEAITIRTIRLRDGNGTVHTIPFGAINTISNMTRDFSFYVISVGVSYRENTDDVIAVLRQIFDELRRDPDHGPDILEDLDVQGVDRFGDSAVFIGLRIKTKPIKQWNVGREFNRRMKLRFDELGIEMPFPHQTIYFGEDKHGRAPPLRVQMQRPAGGGPNGPPAPPAGDEPPPEAPSSRDAEGRVTPSSV